MKVEHRSNRVFLFFSIMAVIVFSAVWDTTQEEAELPNIRLTEILLGGPRCERQ